MNEKLTSLGQLRMAAERSVQMYAQLEEAMSGKQDKLTGTQGQVVGFDESGDAVAQDAAPSAGYSMAGQMAEPTEGTTVTAGESAEIFNDYRERTYSSTFPAQGNIASGD